MSAYPNDKLISVSHLPMVGKLLIGASIINGLVLLFDDIPSETQYKEFLLKKCLPRKVIDIIEAINNKCVLPTSFLTGILSLYQYYDPFGAKKNANNNGRHSFLGDIANKFNNSDSPSPISTAIRMYSHGTSPKPLNDGSDLFLNIFGTQNNKNNLHNLNIMNLFSTLYYLYQTAPSLSKAFVQSVKVIFNWIRSVFTIYRPARLFIISIISFIIASQASKFLWRIKSNLVSYFNTDLKAYERDDIEYRPPNRTLTQFLFNWSEVWNNPTLIGAEKLLPYVQLNNPITPQSSKNVIGFALFKDGFVPYTETIKTNKDLSLTVTMMKGKDGKFSGEGDGDDDDDDGNNHNNNTNNHDGEIEKNEKNLTKLLSQHRPYSPVLNSLGVSCNSTPDSITLPPFSPLTVTSLMPPRIAATFIDPMLIKLDQNDPNNDRKNNKKAIFKQNNNNNTVALLPPSSTAPRSSNTSSTTKPIAFFNKGNEEDSITTATASINNPTCAIPSHHKNLYIPPFGQLPINLPLKAPLYTPQSKLWNKLHDQPTKPRPIMFVANHTTLGADMVPFQWTITGVFNIYPRGLAHRGHFNFPLWSHIYHFIGAVVGTRETTGALLSRGATTTVYPGGGREIMRKKDDQSYDLYWAQRVGFTKLAIEHQAIIVPISCVGSPDMMTHLGDLSFKWLYGNYKMQEKTIELNVEEKFLVELKMIKIRQTQMVEFGYWDRNYSSKWVKLQLGELIDKFKQNDYDGYIEWVNRGSFDVDFIDIVEDIIQNDKIGIGGMNNNNNNNNNYDDNGNYNNITIKKDNHLDDISEEDSKDDKYIKVERNDDDNNNNNNKKQNNNKHKPKDNQNNKNVSKYQQQQQLQQQNKPNEHQPVMLANSVHNVNNTKQEDAKEIETRTPLVPHSILSPVADKTQIKHISNNNNNNNHNNNNTNQILLTNQNTTTNLHYQPKPIPKIPQPNISNDHSVSLPICFPSPNPFKWQRHYFVIGDPIDAADYTGLQNDELAQRHLRDRVKAELERGLANGQQYQEHDEDRYTLHRWGKAIKGLFGY